MYTVQPFLNVGEDGLFFLHGYREGDPVGTFPDLALRVEAPDWQQAAERAWVVGNREGADARGRTWPTDVRSVSMGDVAYVCPDGANPIPRWAAYLVAGVGEVPTPQNRVLLAGTSATKRKEGEAT